MPLEIVTIPCLSDNYAYLAHDPVSGQTAVVDVPEAAPIIAELSRRGWSLDLVLLTHHHWDHVDGLPALLAEFPARVAGAAADAHRLPPLDVALAEGDSVQLGREQGRVIDVSGHTIGHIAFYFADSSVAFTADSLMAMGCGRLFEGDPEMMYNSMVKLAALPANTLICSGHEYTQSNVKFALSVEPGNSDLILRANNVETARAARQPTVPSLLSDELATNPFLRVDSPEIRANLGMTDAPPEQVFAAIRKRKDNF